MWCREHEIDPRGNRNAVDDELSFAKIGFKNDHLRVVMLVSHADLEVVAIGAIRFCAKPIVQNLPRTGAAVKHLGEQISNARWRELDRRDTRRVFVIEPQDG